MSFENFPGFDQISEELIAQNLITAYTPPPPTGNNGPDSGPPGSHNRIQLPSQPITPQQAIYGLFKTTQRGAAQWNTHPAVRMVVEWMKKQLSDPSWQGQSLEKVVFSSIGDSPNDFTGRNIDSGSLKTGGIALLIKSIYNNCKQYDDNIQLDRCNTDIASLNSFIWNNKTNFLITWYQQNFHIWPGKEDSSYLNAYKGALCSKAYKTLKQMQAGSGNWLDANLEMFHHFIKLAACGASDDQINEIYQSLTTDAPILDGSTFGEIYKSHWRNYEGWITLGYLDFGDLGATNLDQWHAYPVYEPGQTPEYSYLAKDVIEHYGFWKSAPSSSCFSASSPVLMASGEVKAISKIQHGDRVSFPPTTVGHMESRIVAFVSKPNRAGRTLYELESFPGIHFTETHPLLAATIDDRRAASLPTLQYVDRLQAASLNPTWQSFETEDIEPRGLIIHEAPKHLGEEFLYDLVFEPDESPSPSTLPIYTLVASNGERLNALSEAPLIEWFPLEMIFMGNIIEAISLSNIGFANVIDQLAKDTDVLQNVLRRVASMDNLHHSVDATVEVTLDSMLLRHGPSDVQNSSDLIEKLIMRLGRAMGKEISTGWLNQAPQSTSAADVIDVVFVHILRRLSDDPKGGNNPIATTWTATIDATEGSSAPRIELDGHIQGHNTLVLHEAIELPSLPKQATTQTSRFIRIELTDHTGDNVWVGGGPLQYDTQSMISVGNLAAKERGNNAVLEVELRAIPRDCFERRREWGHDEGVKYAAMLGYAFGTELVKLSRNVNM